MRNLIPKSHKKSHLKTELAFFSSKPQKMTQASLYSNKTKLLQTDNSILSNLINTNSPVSSPIPKDIPSIEYYHMNKIGYKNYKHFRIREPGMDNFKTNIDPAKKRETLESCIHSIYEQKNHIQPEIEEDLLAHLFVNEMLKDKVTGKKPEFEDRLSSRLDSQRIEETIDVKEIKQNQGKQRREQEELLKRKILEEKREIKLAKLGKFGEDSYEKDLKEGKNIELQKIVSNPTIKRRHSPNFVGNIVNKKRSFKNKQLRDEFNYYVDITRKFLILKRAQLVGTESEDLVLFDYKVKWLEKSNIVNDKPYLY